jgi:nitrate/nitrite-specific signal transduction histidine kinase
MYGRLAAEEISRAFERGDFSFRLLRDSNDEIGDVVNYFNAMSLEIKHARDLMENWNRELEVKVKERTEDLRVLFDISKAIGSSLDLELLIGQAVEYLLPIIKGEYFAVLVPDEKGGYAPRVGRNPERFPLAELQATLDRAAADNQIVFKPNVIVTPLRAKGKTMGILLLGGTRPLAYQDGRVKNLLATISDQLAIAIENVGIYEKEKEALNGTI